jgi:hypothetical protein
VISDYRVEYAIAYFGVSGFKKKTHPSPAAPLASSDSSLDKGNANSSPRWADSCIVLATGVIRVLAEGEEGETSGGRKSSRTS